MNDVLTSSPSLFQRLAGLEESFRPPRSLAPALDKVRDFLREELAEAEPESLSLLRAGLVIAAAEGKCGEDRLIPLAAGVEMIYHALTHQQTAVKEGQAADLFGILSHDLVLARALDLYTSDGDCRVMDAVSRGASHLCEALMAERIGEVEDVAIRHLAEFHAECGRVGAAAASFSRELEDGIAVRITNGIKNVLNPAKETLASSPNISPNEPRLLDELLSAWTLDQGNQGTNSR